MSSCDKYDKAVLDTASWGVLIKTIRNTTEDDCCKQCSATSGCVLTNFNSNSGSCNLKSSFTASPTGKDSGWTSWKLAPAPQPAPSCATFTNAEANTAYWGKLIKTIHNTTEDDCCKQCSATSGCVLTNFNSNSGSCNLKSSFTASPTGKDSGWTSRKTSPAGKCTPSDCNTPKGCPPGNVCVGHLQETLDELGASLNAGNPGFFFVNNYGSKKTQGAGILDVSYSLTNKTYFLSTSSDVKDPSHQTVKCTYCNNVKVSTSSAVTTISYGEKGTAYTLKPPLCLASTTKIPKLVNGNIQHVEVKDLHDGDMIRTTRGDFPISHIMHTHTIGPHTYVKVEKGSLGENTPSQDLYLTHEHSFSLGYYKNSVLNRNIHDPEQDDMVYLHITADQLADKLPGITRVQKEFDAMFNLVFDEHVSLDIYGLEVMMHHPVGNPYTLPAEKYQDKSKINNKVQKPLFAHYGMLENVKPEHMEMKDFLRNCITANLEDKFRLEDVNHPSFAPQKTMLSHDIREKLRVA